MPKNPRVPVDVVANTKGFERGIASATKVATAAFAAFGVAALAAVVGITKATITLSVGLNQLQKDAQRVGTSVEAFQKVAGAISLMTDGTVDAATAVQMLQRNLADAADGTGEAQDALDKLGLSLADIDHSDPAGSLALIADKFGTLDSAAVRSQVAMDLFGRAGKNLVGALSQGGDAVREAAAAIERAGLVSQKTADDAAVLQDQILLASKEFLAFKADALGPLIPVISEVIVTIRLLKEEFGLTSEVTTVLGENFARIARNEVVFFASILKAAQLELGRIRVNMQSVGRVAIVLGETLKALADGDLDAAKKGFHAMGVAAVDSFDEFANFSSDRARDAKALELFRRELRGLTSDLDSAGAATPGGGDGDGDGDGDGGSGPQVANVAARLNAIKDLEATQAEELAEIEAGRLAVVLASEDAKQVAQAETLQKQLDGLALGLSVTASVMGAVGDLAILASELAINATAEESDARIAAQQAAWEVSTAVAIATAALNIPLAISQQLAGTPGPVGIALAVAAGITAGISLGAVIAKAAAGPQFHMGGLVGGQRSITPGSAPDEVNATLLTGERVQNRREAREGGGPMYITAALRVGPRTFDAMTVEALRTGQGATYDASRAGRPPVGRHVPASHRGI